MHYLVLISFYLLHSACDGISAVDGLVRGGGATVHGAGDNSPSGRGIKTRLNTIHTALYGISVPCIVG